MPDTQNTLRDQPVFICGHPKAGTSLVKALFDSHPQLVVYPEETLFFRRFLPQAQDRDLAFQLALADKFLIHIFTWNQATPSSSQSGFPDRDYSQFPFEDVRQAMRRIAQEYYRHTGDILFAAVMAYGEISGQKSSDTRYWVEKSPYNEYFVAQIYEYWPKARCLHVIRDPRDNYASYRKKHPDWQAELFALNWKRSTQAGIFNQEHFGPERYKYIRYEDLVTTPDTTLGEIADFLGITQHDALLRPTRAGESWVGNSMFFERHQSVSTAPIGRWKTALTHQDAAVIEWMTRPWMTRLDYRPECKPTIPVRWRATSWPIRKRIKRLFGN